MKKRLFNYRPLCVVCVGLMIGSIFGWYNTKFAILSYILFAVAFGGLIFLAIKKRKIKYIIVPAIAFFVGLGAYYFAVTSFNKSMVKAAPSVIQCRIFNTERSSNSLMEIQADSCVFDDNVVEGKITIYVYDYDNQFANLQIGSIIRLTKFNFNKNDILSHDVPDAYSYYKNIKYIVSANIEDITYVASDLNFDEKVRDLIKDKLYIGLSNENAELVYSALFGDKDHLSKNKYDAFKLSGVAHLLAVSGLHVGIIVSVLLMILKRIKGLPKLIVVGLCLLFYSYLCGFSPSVVRASIMSLALLLAPLVYGEYDLPSSVSLAGIVVFCLNPLCIFDVSFILSFGCVTGIMLLNKPISNALSKLRMPNSLASSLSISISVTVALVMAMSYYFNNFNLISLLANLILIPIFTLGFTISFIVCIISLILPFVIYVLRPVSYLFDLISLITRVLGKLPFANFTILKARYISIIIYFILMLILSRLCLAKNKNKVMISLPILAVLIISMVV